MTDRRHHNETIPLDAAGNRLDQTLAAMFPEYSRARLKAWILAGNVTVDGEQRRPRDTVFGGERVEVVAQSVPADALRPEAMDLKIAYRDEQVFVIDKPAGLIVHPGAGNPDGTLVNGLLHLDHSLATLPRAGLVHRLDKDTTGLLLVARTRSAFDVLTRAMADRRIKREYLALCVGQLTAGGTIDAPVGRHPVDRKRMAVHDRGREARTHYRIEQRFRGYTLLRVTLDTGRTHQIRVHMAHERHPLVGDPVYGRPAFPRGASDELMTLLREFRRQALHATRLSFTVPGGEDVSVESPLPDDLQALVDALAAEQDWRA